MSDIGSIAGAFKGGLADNVGHASNGDDRNSNSARGLTEKFSEALDDKAAAKGNGSGGDDGGNLRSAFERYTGKLGDKVSDKSDGSVDGDPRNVRSAFERFTGKLGDKIRDKSDAS